MPAYKTPNVYVEEVPTLPPSVAEVSTAIPAFIGYTEKGGDTNDPDPQPVRISSFNEYISQFGRPKFTEFEVTVDSDDEIEKIVPTEIPKHLMYYALQLYFANGGGSCYIISVGAHFSSPDVKRFQVGLAALRKQDEPTLIVLQDAVSLPTADYYALCQAALQQCNKLKDRFVVLDVLQNDTAGAEFRTNIGNNYLKYGAAYTPYLQTSIAHAYGQVTVSSNKRTYTTAENGLLITYLGSQSDAPEIEITLTDRQSIETKAVEKTLTIRLPNAGASVDNIIKEWLEETADEDKGDFEIAPNGTGTEDVTAAVKKTSFSNFPTVSLYDQSLNNVLKHKIIAALKDQRVVLPSSAAMAGVYARVDRDRGVWQAPANVSLASVLGPTKIISNEEQENLNVDSNAGKSINAIRSFTGKGTLVWGARTLAGNDNEWRYISVRRLFNLIEESIQKSTAFAVFESNNAITWLKVRTMVESFLDGLWRQGALVGITAEQAYYVNVGLGRSMTEQDILEGRMIIEIGIAAVRPAEFIILRFSHKLQEA